MTIKPADIIGLSAIDQLRKAGYVIVHSQPTRAMEKAGASLGQYHYYAPVDYWHRMVAESIRTQIKEWEAEL